MNMNPEPRYVLKLFITGRSARSESAIRVLQGLCAEELAGHFGLEVIDVLDRPEEAEAMRILATPTVVKDFPTPIRKVIGDLSDREKVLVGLDLQKTAAE